MWHVTPCIWWNHQSKFKISLTRDFYMVSRVNLNTDSQSSMCVLKLLGVCLYSKPPTMRHKIAWKILVSLVHIVNYKAFFWNRSKTTRYPLQSWAPCESNFMQFLMITQLILRWRMVTCIYVSVVLNLGDLWWNPLRARPTSCDPSLFFFFFLISFVLLWRNLFSFVLFSLSQHGKGESVLHCWHC